MWVQAHVKQFFEAIIERLGSIEKAVQEHSAATHQAKEVGSEEWRQIPGIVTAIIDSKNKAEAERTKHAEDERKRTFSGTDSLTPIESSVGCNRPSFLPSQPRGPHTAT